MKDDNPVAYIDREPRNGTLPVEREGNADFIVRACNSHAKLLEVCKAILPVAQNIEEYLFDKTDDIGNPSLFNQLACLEIEAYSAIAKAERDKP